ncbi:hypothetical protein [Streptomyces sp. NPDC057939]|uniref:hypothetical protein n=1 Tax=Streptomyces sp. NPDC057939 TaxID=3346284 RepID=UPI0036F189F7
MSYWDPMPDARELEGGPLPDPEGGTWTPAPSPCGLWSPSPDRWENRDWRNVPGPFYGAGTDNCWMGREIAPANVLYEDEWGAEFVYRQPRNRSETLAVLGAAAQDPYGGYACDGDDHWTPEQVREWWRDRGRVREWAVALDRLWSASRRADERDAAGGARAYLAHIDGDLGPWLRGYLFRLQEGRTARQGETLPDL